MTGDFSRILVPVDGSEGACRAAAFAASLAVLIDARLFLLHVHHLALPEVLGMRSVDRTELEQIKARVASEAFEKAHEAIGSTEVPIEHIVQLGDPAAEIIRHAADLGASLVIMGTRGLSHMKELILGSVSDKVLRHAPCAVTVVR